jgi:hypothetical protein
MIRIQAGEEHQLGRAEAKLPEAAMRSFEQAKGFEMLAIKYDQAGNYGAPKRMLRLTKIQKEAGYQAIQSAQRK